jgi:hypothetical protein
MPFTNVPIGAVVLLILARAQIVYNWYEECGDGPLAIALWPVGRVPWKYPLADRRKPG